jgi:hypothetical protein
MAVVELFEHIAVFVGFTLEPADAVPETEAAVADVPAVDADMEVEIVVYAFARLKLN